MINLAGQKFRSTGSIFLISGGVTAKVRTINLPGIFLKVVHAIDKVLISVSGNLFALQRQIVLMK